MLQHFLELLQGLLRLLALLEGTGQGVVGDDYGHYVVLLHFLEYLQGLLRLLAILSGTRH